MLRLKRIQISGFRSIREAEVELGDINVVIGANGSGKSNLAAFFSLLTQAVQSDLTAWVRQQDGAAMQLYYGPKVTPEITAELKAGVEGSSTTYSLRLAHAPSDDLAITSERVSMSNSADVTNSVTPAGGSWALGVGPGPGVSALSRCTEPAGQFYQVIGEQFGSMLRRTRAYHFQDTTPLAQVRQRALLSDDVELHADGGNLAAVLLRLMRHQPECYRRLVGIVQIVAPFFDDFVLQPGNGDGSTILRWREKGSEVVFGSHQLSDGTLRFMMLAALLLLPPDELPTILILDEPELGLHPEALVVLADLVYGVADHSQVILLTQSATLLDRFEPDDVIVADRRPEPGTSRYQTSLRRLDSAELRDWTEEYALSKLWDKNLFGGNPVA